MSYYSTLTGAAEALRDSLPVGLPVTIEPSRVEPPSVLIVPRTHGLAATMCGYYGDGLALYLVGLDLPAAQLHSQLGESLDTLLEAIDTIGWAVDIESGPAARLTRFQVTETAPTFPAWEVIVTI